MADVGPASLGDGAETRRGDDRRSAHWWSSIRVRLAVFYSSVLFGLAALVVAMLYLGLANTLDDQPISKRVTEVRPVPGGFVLFDGERIDPYLYIERQANERALETLRQYSFGALAMLFGASLGVGWLVAGRVLQPIQRITAVADEIQATDLSRRIALGGPDDELRRLADTFDGMLGRIDDAFESQRQFIHEASHELRNPLAVIRTNVDVALADPDTPVEDLRETALVVQRSSERMSRLVDDLLVYARQGHLSVDHEPVDLVDVIGDAARDFASPAAERDVALEVGSVGPARVDGDPLALRQALANLVANALRYAPPGTSIDLTAGQQGPWSWIAVADHGPGLGPGDEDRVFQRFWRGDPSVGDKQGRSGLGLTIVRQIAEAHGGEVRLAVTPGGGATFAVWIPAAGETSMS